jgi:hypothetical protein
LLLVIVVVVVVVVIIIIIIIIIIIRVMMNDETHLTSRHTRNDDIKVCFVLIGRAVIAQSV